MSSLLAEMKRRAGVRTDHELAAFMGGAQSTVSHWRKRGSIPEAAVLRFEQALAAPRDEDFARSLVARTVALRLGELNYQRLNATGINAGRRLSYSMVALNLNAIIEEIAGQIERMQGSTGLSLDELAGQLLEDERFLSGVLDWLGRTSAAEMLAREVAASMRAARR